MNPRSFFSHRRRSQARRWAVWVMFCALSGLAFCAETSGPGKWSMLEYSFRGWMGGGELTVRVTPDSVTPGKRSPLENGGGLNLNLQWLPEASGDLKKFDHVSFRLHYPDGRVVEPVFESGPIVVTAGVVAAIRTYAFPFGDNSLSEAWLEFRSGDRTDWLEVPYGFTRNPNDPTPTSEPKGKPPQYAPAMSQMKKGDDIVRWSNVQYQIGPIENGWNLEANIAHRGPIRCVTKLRRAEGRWAIHTPVVSVRVESDSGGILQGEQMSSRLESHTCREDEFEFDFKPLEGRCWGNLVVTVDGVPHSRRITMGTFLEGMFIPPASK